MPHLHWSELEIRAALFLGLPIVLAAHCGPSISKRALIRVLENIR
jgi:hypothetical protein